jgi:7-carboxy-7-deazaguanine synthase
LHEHDLTRSPSATPVPSPRAAKRPRAGMSVVEVFGPTVQGEGPDAGRPAYFVRFAGCDFRCSWCDSMHAVEARAVRDAPRLSVPELLARLQSLPAGPRLVVLTGGNPALLELGELVDALRRAEFDVAVETQGSVWRDWLARVDVLVVSPKPPSSGMATDEHSKQLDAFLEMARSRGRSRTTLKVVVFDRRDLDFAQSLHERVPTLPLLLSTGTDVGLSEADTVKRLRARFRWLCEATAARRELADVRVLPQLHVVAWGLTREV